MDTSLLAVLAHLADQFNIRDMQPQWLSIGPLNTTQLAYAQLSLAMELKFEIGIPHTKTGGFTNHAGAGVVGAARDTLEGILPPEAAVLFRAVLRFIRWFGCKNDTIQISIIYSIRP